MSMFGRLFLDGAAPVRFLLLLLMGQISRLACWSF
jgi:hypothetical protein